MEEMMMYLIRHLEGKTFLAGLCLGAVLLMVPALTAGAVWALKAALREVRGLMGELDETIARAEAELAELEEEDNGEQGGEEE